MSVIVVIVVLVGWGEWPWMKDLGNALNHAVVVVLLFRACDWRNCCLGACEVAQVSRGASERRNERRLAVDIATRHGQLAMQADKLESWSDALTLSNRIRRHDSVGCSFSDGAIGLYRQLLHFAQHPL